MTPGKWEKCFWCNSDMWIPPSLYEAALAGREKIAFYCAYGHSQHYVTSQSETEKLRLERDRLKQNTARLEQERLEALSTANAQRDRALKAEGALKRLKKRSAAGACPCCKRTFSNMATHIRKQHPEYLGDNIVPIKAARPGEG